MVGNSATDHLPVELRQDRRYRFDQLDGFRVGAQELAPFLAVAEVGAGGQLQGRLPHAQLQNILNDLYKGAKNPDRIGDGTTADAVRNELQNLVPTEGKWHLTKAMESQRGLAKWLMDKSNTDPADRTVAIRELQNLMDALAGR